MGFEIFCRVGLYDWDNPTISQECTELPARQSGDLSRTPQRDFAFSEKLNGCFYFELWSSHKKCTECLLNSFTPATKCAGFE